MKQLMFIVSFFSYIAFSSVSANSGFAVQFPNDDKSQQQTVTLKVANDQSLSGKGYLYHDYDYSHRITIGQPQLLKPTQPSHGFRATSHHHKILIRFTLTIGNDISTSATFLLTSNIGGYFNGVNCMHGTCQDYGISASRHEIWVWGTPQ